MEKVGSWIESTDSEAVKLYTHALRVCSYKHSQQTLHLSRGAAEASAQAEASAVK